MLQLIEERIRSSAIDFERRDALVRLRLIEEDLSNLYQGASDIAGEEQLSRGL
jgi:hypothetical protein